jgi:hypothetical protein
MTLERVCWLGSVVGGATAVLPTCERAAATHPKNVGLRDSRGLARALTGHYRGAISDFEYVIASYKGSEGEDAIARERRPWIAALSRGINPFDLKTLRALAKE